MSELVNVAPATDLSTQRQLLDCQPILERKGADLWTLAARAGDELYEALQQTCEREGVSALVLKSEPFVYPVWVKFECWVPAEERALTERASGVVTIVPKPFHRFELEYELRIDDRGIKSRYAELRGFSAHDAERMIRYLLRRERKPSFKAMQLRQHWFQLWKPVNHVNAFGVNWIGFFVLVLLVVGLVMMTAGGAVSVGGVALIAGGVVGAYLLGKQEVLVRCPGKPDAEPRSLIRADSWQAVISGLGDDTQVLRERFMRALDPPFTKGFRHHVEHVWYWGLDGKVEREQFVLTLGRAMVFCQMYQYDRELYVGWDGHLNAGQWVEKAVGKGIDKHARRLTTINAVVPGSQQLTEYDITDLNCLIEWTHARLTKLIRELMDERKIDQEVDFKIQRGERQTITSRGRDGAAKEQGGGLKGLAGRALSGRLRRTG